MKIRITATLVYLMLFAQFVLADTKAHIKSISGEVKIRRGVEESWHPASAGTWLEDIDSILTGEGAEVALEIEDGRIFRMGSNSILDIADLRTITEKELFLLLMSKKIQRIDLREQKTKLRIGNVSVVHGELKTDSLDRTKNDEDAQEWQLERNAALALYTQNFTTNSILKLNNIILKYTAVNDCGEIHYYLAKAFEMLNKPGQALDAYQNVINENSNDDCKINGNSLWVNEADKAIKRLKP